VKTTLAEGTIAFHVISAFDVHFEPLASIARLSTTILFPQPFVFVNLSTSLRPPLNPSFYPHTQSSSALALVQLSSTILLLVIASLVLLLQAVHRTRDTGKFHCSSTAYCKPNVKSPLSPSFTFYVLRRLFSLTSFLPTHPRNPSHLLDQLNHPRQLTPVLASSLPLL